MKFKYAQFVLRSGASAVMLCLLLLAASAAAAGPRAVVEQRSHEFGSVFEGRDVIREFTIENAGDAPLEIENVRTG
jgi:hypothetical protein